MPDYYEPLIILPNGGINIELPEVAIGDNECVDAQNFLFFSNAVRTRPKLDAVGNVSVAAQAQLACSTGVISSSGGLDFIVDTLGQIWRSVSGTGVWSLMTGAITAPPFLKATNMYDPAHNFQAVFGTQGAGAFLWAIQNNISVVSTVTNGVVPPARFVLSHLGRLVAAGDATSLTSLAAQTFYWSAINDPFTWTGATNGSGSTVLTESSDYITGVEAVENIIIVARAMGFSYAIPTGLAFPPYRFETFSREAIGCPLSKTLVRYENVIYYVGPDNVYTFDLQKSTPIGTQIRRSLMLQIAQGVDYQAFISQAPDISGVGNFSLTTRPMYHLVPLNSINGFHYVYDIIEGTWSVHTYGINFRTVFSGYFNTWKSLPRVPYFVDNSTPPVLYHWNDNAITGICEQPAYFTSKHYLIGGDPSVDRQLERCLVEWQDDPSGHSFNPTAAVTGTIQDVVVNGSNTINVLSQSTGRYFRKYMDVGRLTGQNFSVRFSLPANSKALITKFAFLFDKTTGVLRG